mmetsp:Transcript_16386/g.39282  ORF Transcript_16386/g.39282 Transcript_16386/m.39282 type:complete len:305 (+) Transcript_16386:1348-2262(+)
MKCVSTASVMREEGLRDRLCARSPWCSAAMGCACRHRKERNLSGNGRWCEGRGGSGSCARENRTARGCTDVCRWQPETRSWQCWRMQRWLTVHLRSLVIDNASADTDTDDGGYVDGAHRNNYYDLSKWVIDLYSNLAKVEAYGLRFGTVCGASPNLRTDVMLNAMTSDALQRKEVRLYVEHIRRPVLGILDLCRAVNTIIVSPTDNRGLYNICSFNGTVREYGDAVGAALKVPVNVYSAGQVENMTNVKLQSKHYDFAISPAHFEETFNFKFQDTVPSVIDELVQALNDPSVIKATRNVRRSAL